MSNNVDDSKRRVRKVFMLSPEAIEYIDSKAPNFMRGSKGGASRALDSMVLFVKNYEAHMEKRNE